MKINPVAFSIFGIDIMWYGVLIAIGASLCIYFASKLADREKLYDGVISDLALYVILFGVIGARLYYVAFEWDYYSQHLDELFAIRNGGLAIYGGILTGMVVLYVFARVKKLSFFKLADALAPGLALAQGIGRWGNFINGEAHGGETTLPWAIEVDGMMVHPTFLYESILDVGIFLFLYFYMYKKKKFDGHIFSLYLIIYGIGRFLIEGLRTDSLYFGPFRISQIVSLVLMAVGIVLIHKNRSTN
ncbi:MAG: prolipoprotein diacylglyceryl transferase [Peptoniphilus sp.]|nr:prolipoprotein diacylglyceryl transferase [Peptoniphilus sp.]